MSRYIPDGSCRYIRKHTVYHRVPYVKKSIMFYNNFLSLPTMTRNFCQNQFLMNFRFRDNRMPFQRYIFQKILQNLKRREVESVLTNCLFACCHHDWSNKNGNGKKLQNLFDLMMVLIQKFLNLLRNFRFNLQIHKKDRRSK